MPNNHILLERIELNNTATSIVFNNIPQTGYTDLKLVISARTNSTDTPLLMYFNTDTTNSNYTVTRLLGNESGTTSSAYPAPYVTYADISTYTTNTFSNDEIYIPNYTSSNLKSFSVDAVNENNAAAAERAITAGVWSGALGTSSINRVVLNTISGSFVANSTFSLYGIAKLNTTPAIAPKATGGNIIATDGTYWYHAFLSSGTFIPQLSLSADILVVGGGGGGSNSGGIGAGGGAGAINYKPSTSVSAGYSNAVLVGAGGARDNTSVGDGQSGIQSSFASILATVVNKAIGSNNSSGRVGGDGGNSRRTTGGIVGEYFGGLGAASSYPRRGGSGAGAGNSGSSSYPAVGGNGSNTWSSWATATSTGDSGYFAGGGAGGYEFNGSMSRTAGGLGGGGLGGAGTSAPNYNATDGTANTGGGGGGCGGQSGVIGGLSGNGGSGIVIIRYLV